MSDPFLSPAYFIDSDHCEVVAFANKAISGAESEITRAIQLCRAVRDTIVYDAYVDISNQENIRASGVLKKGRGFCVGKACLLAACARAIGIRAGVGYADVRNHMTSPKLYRLMKTDLFVWHSYTELCLSGTWLKATPIFDRALCERLGLDPLEFDGRSDSLLHPFDRAGRQHMEYVQIRGKFADVPYEEISSAFRAYYPELIAQHGIGGDFRAEVAVPENL